MAGVTSVFLLAILGLIGAAVTLGPPYYFCRRHLSFWSFAGLPLGTLLPWVGGLIVVMLMAPFVDPSRQEGYGWTPVLLMTGAGAIFVLSSWIGAFVAIDQVSFLARLWAGVKWGTPFAALVTLYISYLAFYG